MARPSASDGRPRRRVGCPTRRVCAWLRLRKAATAPPVTTTWHSAWEARFWLAVAVLTCGGGGRGPSRPRGHSRSPRTIWHTNGTPPSREHPGGSRALERLSLSRRQPATIAGASTDQARVCQGAHRRVSATLLGYLHQEQAATAEAC